MPFFSVIIPTFNRKNSIISAVDSVLAQTYKDFEIIVVDDGSSDGSTELLKKIYKHHIRLIIQENSGVSSARNRGIEQAQGEWIALLDSDDQWHRSKLEKQKLFIDANREVLISQTQEIWIRNGKRVNPMKKHQKKSGDLFEQSLNLCAISPSSVVIHRSLFELEKFDEELLACEDYDLWLRLTKDHQIGLLDEQLLTKFGGHEDQLSSKYPVMDRFRIYSIAKLITLYDLSELQTELALKVLKNKWSILKLGAEKRGGFIEQEDDEINLCLQRKEFNLSLLKSFLLKSSFLES